MDYLPRAVDSVLAELLDGFGGVVIEGARACGKTSTGLEHSSSNARLDDPRATQLAALDPALLLTGDTPRLIDEWQLQPDLWNTIRHEIDQRRAPGQFILSGSATPTDDIRRHTGVGRIGRLRMRPMSLAESRNSTYQVDLGQLTPETRLSGVQGALTYRELAEAAVTGGWPSLIGKRSSFAARFNRSYVEDLSSLHIPELLGTRPDSIRFTRLFQSLSRNVGSEVNASTMAADINADGTDISAKSVRIYLDALARIFVLEELPAWSVALRSKARLRSQAKLTLAEPALACASLGVSASSLALDPEYFGQVFENMAVRDIRTYASVLDASVFHYRDSNGLEADMVLEFPDGSWAAIEVKLGSSEQVLKSAEANLLKLRDTVDTRRRGEPRFLAVVTGGEFGFTLSSGVHVIPLSALSVPVL